VTASITTELLAAVVLGAVDGVQDGPPFSLGHRGATLKAPPGRGQGGLAA